MTAEAIVSIILGVVSTVVAAYAVWLSAVFYRAGNEAQERVREIANRLEASTEVLNARLQGLQDQTFTLVRDTVEGMRSALWSSEGKPNFDIERELGVQKQILGLRRDLLEEISKMSGSMQGSSEALENAIDELVRRSARIGLSAGEDRARDLVRRQLARNVGGGMGAGELMTAVGAELPFGLVIRTIYEMRDGGEVAWQEEELGPSSVLTLTTRSVASG